MDDIRLYVLKAEQVAQEIKESERRAQALTSFMRQHAGYLNAAKTEWLAQLQHSSQRKVVECSVLKNGTTEALKKVDDLKKGIQVSNAVISSLQAKHQEVAIVIVKKKKVLELLSAKVLEHTQHKKRAHENVEHSELIETCSVHKKHAQKTEERIQEIESKECVVVQGKDPFTAMERSSLHLDVRGSESLTSQPVLPNSSVCFDSSVFSRKQPVPEQQALVVQQDTTAHDQQNKKNQTKQNEDGITNMVVSKTGERTNLSCTYRSASGEEVEIDVGGGAGNKVSVTLQGVGQEIALLKLKRSHMVDHIRTAGIQLGLFAVFNRGAKDE